MNKHMIFCHDDLDGLVGGVLLEESLRAQGAEIVDIVPSPPVVDGGDQCPVWDCSQAGWGIWFVDCSPNQSFGWFHPNGIYDHHPALPTSPAAAALVAAAFPPVDPTGGVDWLVRQVSMSDTRAGGTDEEIADAVAFVQGVRFMFGPPTVDNVRQLLADARRPHRDLDGNPAGGPGPDLLQHVVIGRRAMAAEAEAARAEVATGFDRIVAGRPVWAVNRPVTPVRDRTAEEAGHPTRLWYWRVETGEWQLSFRGDGARECAAAGARLPFLPDSLL